MRLLLAEAYSEVDIHQTRSLAHALGRVYASMKVSFVMTTFHSADDVLTLLIHLGYLTYDSERNECFIPNQEVQQEFINSIEDSG